MRMDGVSQKKSGSHLRTCVGCRKVTEREGLIRIVSSPDGLLVPDPKGKLSGRGAYICFNTSCIRMAARPKVLARVLKRTVDSSESQLLEQRIRNVFEDRIDKKNSLE